MSRRKYWWAGAIGSVAVAIGIIWRDRTPSRPPTLSAEYHIAVESVHLQIVKGQANNGFNDVSGRPLVPIDMAYSITLKNDTAYPLEVIKPRMQAQPILRRTFQREDGYDVFTHPTQLLRSFGGMYVLLKPHRSNTLMLKYELGYSVATQHAPALTPGALAKIQQDALNAVLTIVAARPANIRYYFPPRPSVALAKGAPSDVLHLDLGHKH